MIIAIIMFFCPLIAGCEFLFETDGQVNAPVVTLHESSKCLTWDRIRYANRYKVYCNDQYIEDVSNNTQLTSYVYDFSHLLKEDGVYEFYLISVANLTAGEDSEPSNKVQYEYDSSKFVVPTPKDTAITSYDDVLIGYVINGGQIDIINKDMSIDSDGKTYLNTIFDCYEIYLYSASTGLNVYPIEIGSGDNMSVNILQFNLKDEIYAVRIGGVIGDDHYVCSELKFINPDAGSYTEDKYIYMFDGYINDMYIESMPELKNLIYYAYVYREKEVVIRVSNGFKQLMNNYDGENEYNKLGTMVIECFSSFIETMDNFTLKTIQHEENIFEIQIKFYEDKYLNNEGKPEPELSLTPPKIYTIEQGGLTLQNDGYYEDLVREDKYYETCGYTMRNEDSKYSSNPYNDFVSDKQFLYDDVESSEELYWAVENKITPIPKSGSRAETIYNKAKTVLNSIISDEMTDYEKVVSIFDWICANTKYDYYALESNAYEYAAATLTPVYYLEGVFMTGYAVCDGFSKAFSLMCNMEGIDAIRIVGTAWTGAYDVFGNKEYGGHAWNKVKLDKDPTDIVDGQYYLVDITWTTFLNYYIVTEYGTSYVQYDKEVASHSYFLVGDSDVVETHEPFVAREKFLRYSAIDNYNYYENTFFTYNNETYDLVIDSVEDMTPLFYYLFSENIETFEIVIDYEFMEQNYIDGGGKITSKTTDSDLISALIATMKSKKVNEQYISLNQQYYWQVESYNEDGDLGVILVLEQFLLIDAVKTETSSATAGTEARHIIDYLSLYEAYGEFGLYVTDEVLEILIGSKTYTDAQVYQAVVDLFEPYLADGRVDITLELMENNDPVESDKHYFRLGVEPKKTQA